MVKKQKKKKEKMEEIEVITTIISKVEEVVIPKDKNKVEPFSDDEEEYLKYLITKYQN